MTPTKRIYRPQNEYVPEFLRGFGVTYRQVDYWCKRGYLRPLQNGQGSGVYRWWPPSEVQIALRMVALVNEGYQPAAAARRARGEAEE